MKNFVQPGKVVDYQNGTGSAIKSGDVVVFPGGVGIAAVDIPVAGVGSVQIEGVFTCAKATSLAIAQGDKLYYDATNHVFNKTAMSNTLSGFAFLPALSADVLVQVCLKFMGA